MYFAVSDPRRVSNTMCALSSVARLSVSMTMSMSSGLFSMVEDEEKEVDKDHVDTDHKQEEKLMIEFTRSERRHSLPLPATAMSDIEEESSCSQRGSDSPINSSGIRIIIDEGSSDSSSNCSNKEVEPMHPFIITEDEDEDSNNDRRVSNISAVHLLS